MIYLDYMANNPVDAEVLDIFYKATINDFANPNSSHSLGRIAKEKLDQTSMHILDLLHLKEYEIIYTSGASEANNLVIKGVLERYKNKGKHVIIGCLEHNSITVPLTYLQQFGFEVDVLSLTSEGLIDLDELEELITNQTILVSICAVDSELGIRQPIEKIAELLKKYPQCFFHTDASQAIGKTDICFQNVDLVTLTPHKFYGLNGFGALIKRTDIGLIPLIHGGKSTTIYRSGTPLLAQVIAFDKALSIAIEKQKSRNEYVKQLHDMIIDELSHYPHIHINSTSSSIPYIINFSLKNNKNTQLIKKLEEQEIYLSAKTSCCPQNTPSKLVYALTHDKKLASSSIRLSLSHLTTLEEIKIFIQVFQQSYQEINNGKISRN